MTRLRIRITLALFTLLYLLLCCWMARAADEIQVGPRPWFSACDAPGAHELCWATAAETQCVPVFSDDILAGAQIRPPLCEPFEVTLRRDGVAVRSLGRYRAMPDFDDNGVVGLRDYGVIANGFGISYSLKDVGCFTRSFAQRYPLPAYALVDCR